ncbi:MAG: DNA topoisomerase I [Nanoarchaeota archaeon]
MPRKIIQNTNEDTTLEQEDIPMRATAKKIYKNEKQKQTEERKDFVPITNPKITTEVQERPRLKLEQIEKIETRAQSDKEDEADEEKGHTIEKEEKIKKPRKKSKGVVEEIESKPKKLEILKGNSILIITEKPQAAEKIAAALSNGKDERYSDNGISYYEFQKDNQHIIVACAVGHLFSLSQDVKGSNYPIFEVSWKPNFEVRKKDFTKKYYTNLQKLMKRAKEIMVATDYDIEGEVIGYNIVRFIGHQKDAKRMKYSSLTKDELEEAYQKASPTIDWGQAMAGETRHFIDWYYGINLSRALMNSIKTTGKFKIMSIGRVQGPALKLIVEKEREIEKFRPVPYFKIFIDIRDKKDKKNQIKLRHVKDIFDEKELPKFEKLKDEECEVITTKNTQTIIPPFPFDLTTLQTEAYRFFSISPARTLQIAQGLYLAGIISYPRTSSQKIPEAINPKAILKKLSKSFPQVKLCTRAIPVEGKKSDPAHPSISPTGESAGKLEAEDKKIYDLIVKRFIACFCADATVENKTITATAIDKKTEEKLLFKERGAEIKERGWMEVYAPSVKEKELKDMNGTADILKVEIEKDETKPPKRFSPASIISELEKRGLGTKATRANILETLYDRDYISDNKSIKATPLGINLIQTMEKYSPIIIDEKLTKDMEKDMEAIRVSKKELDKKQESVLRKARVALTDISEDFHKKEAKIGEELMKAEEAHWAQQKIENELVECPVCKKGKLAIKFNPRFKRSFIACNAYPDCKTTFSLPPGMIKKVEAEGKPKLCDRCGSPMLMRLMKGKRPWIFCFNPNCPSREEQANARKKEDAEETTEKQEDN